MTSFKPSDELKQKLYVIIFKSDTKGGKLFDVLLLIVIVFSFFLILYPLWFHLLLLERCYKYWF